MASWESGDVQDTDAARQAAEVAVELSEQEQPPDPRRLVRALRGRVFPIGGLKEKLLAALQGGSRPCSFRKRLKRTWLKSRMW